MNSRDPSEPGLHPWLQTRQYSWPVYSVRDRLLDHRFIKDTLDNAPIAVTYCRRTRDPNSPSMDGDSVPSPV